MCMGCECLRIIITLLVLLKWLRICGDIRGVRDGPTPHARVLAMMINNLGLHPSEKHELLGFTI